MCQSPASQANPTPHNAISDTTIVPSFTGNQFLSTAATLAPPVERCVSAALRAGAGRSSLLRHRLGSGP